MKIFLATMGQGVTRATHGSNGRWSIETVLEGFTVTCLAADPIQPEVVYAGTRDAGVLRSADAGKTWKETGLSGHTVKAIGASRLSHSLLYAGTKPACMFFSEDRGEHWKELTSFRRIFSRRFWFSPAEKPFSAYVQGIALSPTHSNVILVGIEAGAVVRSEDGGQTWQDHRKGALRDCHSLTFHASDGDWAYEGGGTGAGVAVSRDGGNVWQQPTTGLDRHYGWACAADPRQPEICYVSASLSPRHAHGSGNAQAYIYRSSPGKPWQKLGGGLPQPLRYMPYSLLTDPREPDCVYAGLSNGDVWRSSDRGDAWEQLPLNLKSIHRQMLMLE